mmetsp:Transcript_58752/g.163979  ORF Transcript_58752/g.163979 Transcript_58752/m.163979 type:complete len:215 (-) Transcript_58752:298-942(-)
MVGWVDAHETTETTGSHAVASAPHAGRRCYAVPSRTPRCTSRASPATLPRMPWAYNSFSPAARRVSSSASIFRHTSSNFALAAVRPPARSSISRPTFSFSSFALAAVREFFRFPTSLSFSVGCCRLLDRRREVRLAERPAVARPAAVETESPLRFRALMPPLRLRPRTGLRLAPLLLRPRLRRRILRLPSRLRSRAAPLLLRRRLPRLLLRGLR